MNIVITGGSGFLGQKLARALLAQNGSNESCTRLLLADRVAGADLGDARVQYAIGDTCDRAFVARLAAEADVIYHLAAVVSSEAEADFDLGMRVNIDAARLLLDECRAAGRCPRVIFTSSVAVFGPSQAGVTIGDDSAVDPRSSYGMEKAVVELLVAEYSRRGFIDGLTLRLPTISVPACPTGLHHPAPAASSASRCPGKRRSAPCRTIWHCGFCPREGPSPRSSMRGYSTPGALVLAASSTFPACPSPSAKCSKRCRSPEGRQRGSW